MKKILFFFFSCYSGFLVLLHFSFEIRLIWNADDADLQTLINADFLIRVAKHQRYRGI